MSGHRPERIGDLIRDHLSRLLREELRDPRVGFVTITDVRVSPDLRHARVFVSRLGTADERGASVAALNRAVPFFRRELARIAALRRTPEILFEEDAAIETGSRVEHLLDEIREASPSSPETPEDSGPETAA